MTSRTIPALLKRRRVIVWVGEETVLNLFWTQRMVQREERHFVRVPIFPNQPEDAQVVSVHHDFMRRGFGFVLQHESFAEVNEGEMLPAIGPTRIEIVEVPAIVSPEVICETA